MVSAEKNSEERPSSESSPNGLSTDGSAADDTEHEGDHGMRVGTEYQAIIPEILNVAGLKILPRSVLDHYPECLPEKALLVWSPSPEITEMKLDEFVSTSKEKYGYNAEQALGMLFWHKHDLERAFSDLPNFTPFPDEWTVEDKVLFEQAFQFHGKSFHRIRQMLPDKSISSLVKYYYSWKKTRCRTSVMDRQARKRASQRDEGSEIGSDDNSNSDSDYETNKEQKDNQGGIRTPCANCSASTSQGQATPKGNLCPGCYHYWRRTGSMKPASGPIKKQDLKDRHNPIKSKRKPPRGMYLNHEDLKTIALGPPGQGDAVLKSMDSEVVALKRQVQNSKQIISALKHKTGGGIDEYRLLESSSRMNARWTNEELLLAVQGVRKYGKDFKAIAECIGNKTEAHIKSFFINYRRRYNLDDILQEYEAENGPIIDDDDKDEKMDIDISPSNSASNSNSGTSTPVAKTFQSASSTLNNSATNNNTSASSSNNSGTSNPPLTMITSVPPPLLKPVQSPSIMNRPPPPLQAQQAAAASRFPITRTPQQPPPPLIRPNSLAVPIMAAMRPSHNQPPQLLTRSE